jgi:hypothetical protein
MRLAGIVYLLETSQLAQLSKPDANRRDLDIFQKLCGTDALSSVVIGVTKGGSFDHGERERNLWEGAYISQPMIYPIRNTSECAWDIVNLLLSPEKVNPTVLQIQRELVDFGKVIHDTEAGKHVDYRFQVNISLARRILMFLGMDVSPLHLL